MMKYYFYLKDNTVVLEINRFDPGKWAEPDRLSPTTLLPEDVPIHCRVCIYREREREGGKRNSKCKKIYLVYLAHTHLL